MPLRGTTKDIRVLQIIQVHRLLLDLPNTRLTFDPRPGYGISNPAMVAPDATSISLLILFLSLLLFLCTAISITTSRGGRRSGGLGCPLASNPQGLDKSNLLFSTTQYSLCISEIRSGCSSAVCCPTVSALSHKSVTSGLMPHCSWSFQMWPESRHKGQTT